MGANGTVTQLNMDKKTYNKLFPPIERFSSTQGRIGNCWQITGFNGILRDPLECRSIYECIRQEGDDIVISFPNGKLSEIRFENGQLPVGADPKRYSSGSLGINLLECAQAKDRQAELIGCVTEKYLKAIPEAQTPEEIQTLSDKLAEFTQFAEENRESVYIYIEGEENENIYTWINSTPIDKLRWNTGNGSYDFGYTTYRDGGYTSDLFDLLGYKSETIINYGDFLSNTKNFDDYIIAGGTKGEGEMPANVSNGLYSGHAYWIERGGVSPDGTNMISTLNPWGTVQCELYHDAFSDQFRYISVAKRKYSGV